MTAARLNPARPELHFGLIALAIYTAVLLVIHSSMFPRAPELAAGAVTFDLVVCVPVIFYLLVVRRRRLPPVTVVPVFLASLFGASVVLPTEHQSPVALMGYLAIPAELLLVGYVAVRAYRSVRRGEVVPTGVRPDILWRLRSALRNLVPVPAVASAVAHEIAFLYYASLSWGARSDVRDGELGFTYHRKNGYAGILWAVAVMTLIETAVVHLLVERWRATAAWGLSIVSLYGVIWLLGHLQSVRLRPMLLTSDSLHVRIGLLWNVRVPYTRIARVVRLARRDVPARSAPGYLRAAPLGPPQLLLELREPVDVEGLYGYTKRGVLRIGISVDDRDRFATELEARVPAASPR